MKFKLEEINKILFPGIFFLIPLSSYQEVLFGFSPLVFLIIFFLFFNSRYFFSYFVYNPKSFILLLLLAWLALLFILLKEFPIRFTVKHLIYPLILIILPLVVSYETSVNALKFLLGGIMLSYCWALGQALDIDFFTTTRLAIQDFHNNDPKHRGLSATPIALVYFVSFATLFCVGCSFKLKTSLALICALIALLVAVSLASKSMIFVIVVITMGRFVYHSNVGTLLLTCLIACSLALIVLFQTEVSNLVLNEERYSARLIAYFVLHHDELIPNFRSWSDLSGVGALVLFDGLSANANAVSEYSFHEVTLRGLTHFSYLSSVLLLTWLLFGREIYLFYKSSRIRHRNLFMTCLISNGLSYGLAGLIMLSFFHNAGLFSGDLFTFAVFGLVIKFRALESADGNDVHGTS